jgi:hypothetical protein
MMEKIIKKLPDTDVTILSITKSNSRKFRWVENNEEFKFEGKLYDLVRIRNEGDTTFFYCINDTQEEKLIANLDDHLQKDTDIQTPQNKKIQTLQEKIIKDCVGHNSSFQTLCSSKKFLFNFFNENLTAIYPEIDSPPPKNIL